MSNIELNPRFDQRIGRSVIQSRFPMFFGACFVENLRGQVSIRVEKNGGEGRRGEEEEEVSEGKPVATLATFFFLWRESKYVIII